jgi:threonine dehydrogenase-like Zn-dependent dehydrogenase
MGITARASVMTGREFDVREYPVPEVEPGRVLVKQELGGICGTDLHNWQFQRLGFEVILGHENVGTLDALGAGVSQDTAGKPVQVGDRVVVSPSKGVGWRPSEKAPYLSGGFSQYIYLWDPKIMFLKTDLPSAIAVLTEPSACSYHCVTRAGIQLGDTVVIQGTGPIGLLAIAWARRAGAGRLIAVGGPAGRLEFAERLGADLVINIDEVPDAEERIRIVRDNTPRGAGADVVCECAGFLAAIPEGLDYLRRSGTYVEFGHFVDTGTFECNPNQMLMRKNLRLEAAWGFEGPHFVRSLALLEQYASLFEGFVSHVIPLDRVPDGFHALDSNYRLDGRDALKIAIAANSE